MYYFSTAHYITETQPPTTGSLINFWNGSSWESKPLKYWTGTVWTPANLKWWSGAAWVLK